jgi:2',3'-cyclic-nucleotide 2'-phosphodiesterase (5'-nucleotidase family)
MQLVPSLLLLLPLAAPSAASAAAVPDVPADALVSTAPVPDLEILHTGDVMGYLDTCGCKVNPSGGLPRRAWVGKQLRTLFPEAGLVLLDAGNFSDNPTSEGEARTRALLEGMNQLGYAAANVGERELTAGFEGFARATRGARFPFLSANVVRQSDGKPVFTATTVIEVPRASGAPVRVGVVGLTRRNPTFQKAGPDGENLVIADPQERLAAVLPALRRAADVVVLLAAMPENDVRALARAHPEIDVVLGSHGRSVSTQDRPEGRTPVRYMGIQGRFLGEVRLTLGPGRRPTAITSLFHQLDPRYPSEPAMADYLARTLATLQASKLDPLPETPKAH